MIEQVLIYNPFDWKKLNSYLPRVIRGTIKKEDGTFVKYNHTGLKVNYLGKDYLVHSIGRGVTMIPYDEWYKSDPTREVLTIEFNSEFFQDTLKIRILDSLNIRYNRIGLVFGYIFNRTGIWLGSKKSKLLYCYQFVEFIRGNPNFFSALPQLSVKEKA